MQKVSEKQEHWLESCIDMISGLVRANISNGQQVAYMSSYPIFVLILLHICVLILLSGLVRANISNGQQVADSAYIYVLVPNICPLCTRCVSSYYYICVLSTTYVSSYFLLHMCPHTYLSSFLHICVLILLSLCPHCAIYPTASSRQTASSR